LKPVGDEWLYTEVGWPGAGEPFSPCLLRCSHFSGVDLELTWRIPYSLHSSLAGFHFIYKPAYVKNPNANCVNQRQACWASTKWLQVSLVSVSDPNRVYEVRIRHIPATKVYARGNLSLKTVTSVLRLACRLCAHLRRKPRC
jgi:hypothetical protein